MQMSFPLYTGFYKELRRDQAFKGVVEHPGSRFVLSLFCLELNSDQIKVANGALILRMRVGGVEQFAVYDIRRGLAEKWMKKFYEYWNAQSEEALSEAREQMFVYANETQRMAEQEVMILGAQDSGDGPDLDKN